MLLDQQVEKMIDQSLPIVVNFIIPGLSASSRNSFPISAYLNSRRFYLGDKLRMLGCQSAERMCGVPLMDHEPMYYRTVLQLFLKEHQLMDFQCLVGSNTDAIDIICKFIKCQRTLSISTLLDNSITLLDAWR